MTLGVLHLRVNELQHDYQQASAYVIALTGDINAVIDWRCIQDKDKSAPAILYRGTLQQCWQLLCDANARGYGVFACVNEMDGVGRMLPNVYRIRTHYVDLDDLALSQQGYQDACNWGIRPSFAVNTSPGKYHIYWPSTAYRDVERFANIERKLRTKFSGDLNVIDATRVLRVPGFYHCKGEPQLVTCHALPGYGYVTTPEALEAALSDIIVRTGSGGVRQELGDGDQAPTLEWAVTALNAIDPNELSRHEWITVTSAFKQAAWSHTDPATVELIWQSWCARYSNNDTGENNKQWNSIRQTEVGFKNLVNRSESLQGLLKLGNPVEGWQPPQAFATPQPQQPGNPAPLPTFSNAMLTAGEQAEYFKGCVLIERFGEILVPTGRMMGPGDFNAKFGGKHFIIDDGGTSTDEPWKAATRSRQWTVPKCDHIRFVPIEAPGAFIRDDLGRFGVNTYKPALVNRRQGDVTPYLRHIELIMPHPQDRKHFHDFMAHNAKFPGFKIPWAFLIQSEEGAGKGIIKAVLRHLMGGPYVHFPNAQELIESGSKFNAWMRAKLFIVVDEIKVDERRDMIEVLKPMISEAEIEIQGKGHDQDKEDNYSNWIFFSNYKDAIPIRKNGRRFAILYSAIQSLQDLLSRGMDQGYFDRLYSWLEHGGGKEIIADYYMNYPIERGSIPMRAPETSSTQEALRQSRGPIETVVLEAIEDALPGFRGGWIGSVALANVLRQRGIKSTSEKTLATVLEGMGYRHIARAPRAYFNEGGDANRRSQLYHINANTPHTAVVEYGRLQGWEG